ncbi:unnamed protein product [Rhizophagus irregularis]|nr:unnamed protein product [Rhizophagus irregularis]
MVHLFNIAAIVKNTSTVDYKAFHQACNNIFNKRYREFNDLQYLLAFFLHPAWKGGGLNLETVESLGKVHRYILSNAEKELSYTKTYEEDYIRNLVSMATVNNDDEYDDLPDDSDLTDLNDEKGSDANSSQNTNAIAQLDIEETVDLLPWVVIDPTFIPQCTRSFSDDDGESDFDVADLVKK